MARRKTRRRRKRKMIKRKRKTFIPRLLGNSIVTRMKFVASFSLDPGAGAITSRVFSATGITVADITGSTGQPTGLDQFAAFFGRYKVLGSKISMSWVPNTTTNVIPGVYGVFSDDDATLAYTDYETLLMGNQSHTRNIRLAGVLNGGHFMQKTGATYSPKKVLRMGGSQELDLYGTEGANPVQSQFFQCWYGSPDISNNPGAANFLVTIDYVVLWVDKQLTVGSSAP